MKKTQTTQIKIELALNAQSLWEVLTQSKFTQAYMFNCSVKSDWQQGSLITWQGNYQGYEAFQTGEVLAIKPYKLIKYSTFDPNFELSDISENYIHVTYVLEEHDGKTTLTINNDTFDGNKERMQHVLAGWEMVVKQIEQVVVELNKQALET